MNNKKPLHDPMEQSMQGTSQFVAFQASMQQSMCGSSQKIPINNASTVNRLQFERDMKAYKDLKGNSSKVKQSQIDDEQNQFLHVGKWNKSKQSQIRKSIQQQVQNSHIAEEAPPQISKKSNEVEKNTVSKWEKKRSIESSNVSQGSIASNKNNAEQQQQKKYINQEKKDKQQVVDYLKNKEEKHVDVQQQQELQEQQEQGQQDEQQEQEQQQEEDDQQEQQQQQQQQEEQQQEEQDDEEDDQQNGDEVNLQEQEQLQQEEQIQDKFATGIGADEFQQSSQAVKTQTVNTSAVNNTPRPTKWNKKKAPLETMTKYEGKQITENEAVKKAYYSRLNSATEENNNQDQIAQDIAPENPEWMRVQKILLRLKMMLA